MVGAIMPITLEYFYRALGIKVNRREDTMVTVYHKGPRRTHIRSDTELKIHLSNPMMKARCGAMRVKHVTNDPLEVSCKRCLVIINGK